MMEKQTLDKLVAALKAVEKDLSEQVTELAAKIPPAGSRRKREQSMNKSCASTIS